MEQRKNVNTASRAYSKNIAFTLQCILYAVFSIIQYSPSKLTMIA